MSTRLVNASTARQRCCHRRKLSPSDRQTSHCTSVHLLPAPSAASPSLPGLSLLRLVLRSSRSPRLAGPSSCCSNVAHGSERLDLRPSVELALRLTARPQHDVPAEIESKQSAEKTDRAPDVAISGPLCTVQTLRFVQRISHQSGCLTCRPNNVRRSFVCCLSFGRELDVRGYWVALFRR